MYKASKINFPNQTMPPSAFSEKTVGGDTHVNGFSSDEDIESQSSETEFLEEVTRKPPIEKSDPRPSRNFSTFADDDDMDSGLVGDLNISSLSRAGVSENMKVIDNAVLPNFCFGHSRGNSGRHQRSKEPSSTRSSLELLNIRSEEINQSIGPDFQPSPIPNLTPSHTSVLPTRLSSRDSLFAVNSNKNESAKYNAELMRWEGFDEPDLSGFDSGSDISQPLDYNDRNAPLRIQSSAKSIATEDFWDSDFEEIPDNIFTKRHSVLKSCDSISMKPMNFPLSNSHSKENGSLRTFTVQDISFDVPKHAKYNEAENRWEFEDEGDDQFPSKDFHFLDDENIESREKRMETDIGVTDEKDSNAFFLDSDQIRHFFTCEQQHNMAMNKLLTTPVYSRLKRNIKEILSRKTICSEQSTCRNVSKISCTCMPIKESLNKIALGNGLCASQSCEDFPTWSEKLSVAVPNNLLGNSNQLQIASNENNHVKRGRIPPYHEGIINHSPTKSKYSLSNIIWSPRGRSIFFFPDFKSKRSRSPIWSSPSKVASCSPSVLKSKRVSPSFSQYEQYLKATTMPESSQMSFQDSPTRLSNIGRRLHTSNSPPLTRKSSPMDLSQGSFFNQTTVRPRYPASITHFDGRDLKSGIDEINIEKSLDDQIKQLRENESIGLLRVQHIHELITSMCCETS